MSRSFTLNQLTEGIRDRNVGAEGNRLISKWSRTGLLRGLTEHSRETMARLLENQAAQLLRESNSISTGGGSLASSNDLQGFTNIAFPIVRRVFGGLVANELVSIQPMSLPSGLLFYLDYTYGTDVGGTDTLRESAEQTGARGLDGDATYDAGGSIYGTPTGKAIREGANAVGGNYDLIGSAYTKVQSGSKGLTASSVLASGSFRGGATLTSQAGGLEATGSDGKLLQFDVQVSRLIEENAGTGNDFQAMIFDLNKACFDKIDQTNAKSVAFFSLETSKASVDLEPLEEEFQSGKGIFNLRRLNQVGTWNAATQTFTPNALVNITSPPAGTSAALLTVMSGTLLPVFNPVAHLSCSYAIADKFDDPAGTGSTLVIPSFESNFASDPRPIIPEIDIKIESIAVTATTRKLRARWSPELAQDLNAYHSLDAEVELTQILSEQIALEIDREILNDLLVEARGANYYWSRSPGKFVNKTSGQAVELASSLATGPSFTGTVREWYETLVETIIDVANEIHRKTLRGSANFIVVSPEVATIFEASVLYKPSIKIDGNGQASAPFQLGAAAIGSLSNRFTVYKDPYFPRNKILVGYKGGSYLETGYVYAPYVPLIVTPTIFAPEDFTPRKGVMTRYGKKMVRADFYGTVTCLDMDII
jgi:hypothetical protein